MTTNEPMTVDCGTHGKRRAAFACKHLVFKPKQEWFRLRPTETNPWPDAWCKECNDLIESDENIWSQEFAVQTIKLLCHVCYGLLHSRATADHYFDEEESAVTP